MTEDEARMAAFRNWQRTVKAAVAKRNAAIARAELQRRANLELQALRAGERERQRRCRARKRVAKTGSPEPNARLRRIQQRLVAGRFGPKTGRKPKGPADAVGT
jgi:hypothetical protein